MQDSLLSYLTQGGPILWVLIGCSVVLIALIFERWSKLRTLDVDHEWLLAQMSSALQARDVARATQICQQAPGCLPRIFEGGLFRAEHARDEIESAMSTKITQQTQLLEKNMSSIGTMAVVAPFIGLFGTVLGIVRSFKDLGGSNPAAVNAGIAEALAATAAGLFVAILAVVCFNYFKNRVRSIVSQFHVSGAQLVEMIVLSRSGRAFPLDLQHQAPAPQYAAAPQQQQYAVPQQHHPVMAPPTQMPHAHAHQQAQHPDARYQSQQGFAPPPPPYVPPTSWPHPPRDGAAA